jgi:DNA-cytosine methyltransferase
MQKIKVATVFSGGGIGIAALDKSKYEFVFAVEYDAKLAGLYSLNYPGSNMMVKRIQDVTEAEVLENLNYGELDILQGSPVCKNFSKAKRGGFEGDEELSQAQAVSNIIQWTYPKYVVVENVMQYKKSTSFESIVTTLTELGYKPQWKVVNAANYGVAQTRKRLLLVASRRDMPDYIWPRETHHDGPEIINLFGEIILPWVGWHAAVKDILHTLPEAKFANWQLTRLDKKFSEPESFLMRSQNVYQEGQNQTRPPDWPAMTITANERPRAFLAAVQGEQSDVFYEEEPAQTITSGHGAAKYRALLVGDQRSNSGKEISSRADEDPSLTVDTRPAAKWKAFIIPGDNTSNTTVLSDEEPMATVRARSTGQCPARAYLVESKNAGQEWGKGYKEEDQPSPTVTAYDRPAHQPKAFIVDGAAGDNGSYVAVRDEDEPIYTIMSSIAKKPQRAWLEEGRVVQMTPRALCRFQSVPDSWQLSGHNTTDCVAIGNGIPSLVIQILFEAMNGLAVTVKLVA